MSVIWALLFFFALTDDCPTDKCYYVSREDSLCIAFFEDSTYNYAGSKHQCERNNGHLAILDTKRKNQWVARFIQSNTSKSSRIMKIPGRVHVGGDCGTGGHDSADMMMMMSMKVARRWWWGGGGGGGEGGCWWSVYFTRKSKQREPVGRNDERTFMLPSTIK